MRVLVLGCGEMGEMAVEDLYKHGDFDEIVVGTRSIEKVNRLRPKLKGKKTRISPRKIDITHSDKLDSLMKDCDVAINCTGPNYKHEVHVAKAAIKAGVNLVDINDEYESTFKMLELDSQAKKAGIILILGLGASPGINNILAKAAADQLDEVEEIHTAWVMSGADPGGLALSYHLLYSLSGKALTYKNGKFVEVQSFVDGRESLEFPKPVGVKDVYHVGHPKPITLSRSFKKARIINDKATFIPPFVNDLIRSLGKMVREADGLVRVGKADIHAMDFAASYLHKKCKSLAGVPKEGALRVAVIGKRGKKAKKVVYSTSGRLSEGTGISASIGAQMICDGKIKKKGVLPPEECVDWREFLKTILSRRVGRLSIKEEDIG